MTTQARAASDRRRIILFSTLAVIVIALVGLVGYFSRTGTVPEASKAPVFAGMKAGQVAPDFTLSTTAGPFQLSKERDEPTLLEVFATWCPHCQAETFVLNSLYDADKTKVHFVAVNGSNQASETDPTIPESQADVVAFGQRFHVRYPIAFDQDLTVGNQYLEGGFPTIVLIGRDGKVQATHSGEAPPASIQQALDASLAGKTPDPAFGLKDPQ